VLATFRMVDGSAKDMDPRFWFKAKSSVLRYLKKAGKPVHGTENTYYDEPFEYRWDYCVIEKVFEGPMSTNEIIGFWHATYPSIIDGKRGILKVEKCEAPFDHSGTFNLTGIG